jgi:hypothetical protein
LEDKLNTVYNYARIQKIFCEVSNPCNLGYQEPINKLNVIKIAVPPGTPSYMKSRLKELPDILSEE